MEILQDDKVNFELLLEVARKHREYVASLPKTVWDKDEAPFLDNCADFESIFPNIAHYEQIINSLSYQQLLDFTMEMTNSIDDIALIFNHPAKYSPDNLKKMIEEGGNLYSEAQYKYASYKVYFPLLLLYKNDDVYYDGADIANTPVFLADLCRNFKAHNREMPKELEYAIIYAIKYRYNLIKTSPFELADIKDLLDYMQNRIPLNGQIFNTLYFLPSLGIDVSNSIEKGHHYTSNYNVYYKGEPIRATASTYITAEAYKASCRLDGVIPERKTGASERLIAEFMKMINPYRYGKLDLEQNNEQLFAQQEMIWNAINKANNI